MQTGSYLFHKTGAFIDLNLLPTLDKNGLLDTATSASFSGSFPDPILS